MRLVGEVGYNRDDDRKEFGDGDRVVRVYRFKENERPCVCLSFELGRKDDDTLSLTLELGELLTAIASCDGD